MKRVIELLSEIHRRFVWQAFTIYLLVAFVAYHVSEQIAVTRDLPIWFIDVAGLLLIIGLPIVLTTAVVQEGIPSAGRSDPDLRVNPGSSGSEPLIKATSRGHGFWQIFTWRNAILGGVAAFTLWAMVAAGWLILAQQLVSEAQRTEQQESVSGGER